MSNPHAHAPSAGDVAQYLFLGLQEQGRDTTPMKLLKLLNIAQGMSLGHRKEPLFAEDILAWVNGPLVKSVYRALEEFGIGSNPIIGVPGSDSTFPFTKEERQVMDEVVRAYGATPAIALAEAMLLPGTPWHVTRELGQRVEISKTLIAAHYARVLSKEAVGL